jgi:excisionase family DNA binding protein
MKASDLTHLNDHSPDEGFIRRPELARRLKKSERTMQEWTRRGILPCVKAGHSVLYNWEDVKRHLRERYGVLKDRR